MGSIGSVGFRPGELIAVELPTGPSWLELLERAWREGGAVMPVEPSLPEAERRRQVLAARPATYLRADGTSALPDPEPVSEDAFLVVPTSGSTGEPKLVELGRRAVEHAVRASAQALGATGGDPWLCCLPLSHVGGMLVVLRAILLGSPVRILSRFDARAVAAESRAAFVSLVPTMLVRLLDAGADLHHYRSILIGGSALEPSLRRRAEVRGARLVHTYGLTESCGGVVYEGRPLAEVGVRLSEDGEVQLSGPTLMRGYRLDAASTAAAFTPDGWLRTADRGAIQDGLLRIFGPDDRIVSGGENVPPEAVERRLAEHPKVAEVLVIGRPDPEWGDRVTALIVPTDPDDPPSLEELRAHGRAALPAAWLPAAIELVERVPSGALGKRRRLRE